MLRPLLWCAMTLALAAAVVTGGAGTSGAEERAGRFPGLPFIPCIATVAIPCQGPDDTVANDFGWLNTSQLGITGSVPSKQWGRIPLAMVASVAEIDFEDLPPGAYDSQRLLTVRVRAFFTSPPGSDSNYGSSPFIPVRTVAFGTIPAEVTLQVVQGLDARREVEPLQFASQVRIINRPQDRPDIEQLYIMEDPRDPLDARVQVKVVALKLDGIDVGIGPRCSTGPEARLQLTTRRDTFERPPGTPDNYIDRVSDPNLHFNGLSGGSLHGSIDIPAFRDCTTRSGDDVSAVLTSAISGPGNPVQAKVGLIACLAYGEDGRTEPNPPGVTSPFDPRSNCDTELVSGNYTAVPRPLEFPDVAPEDYVRP